MIYKYLFYISIPLVLLSCGGNEKESSEAAPISDSEVNISTPAIDDSDISSANTNENNEVIDKDMDDADIGSSHTNTNEYNEVIDNDIDDSDLGRENTNTNENNENTLVIGNDIDDIDDSDPVLLLN